MKFLRCTCRLVIATLGVSLATGCGESWSSAAGERSPVGVAPVPSDEGGPANAPVTDANPASPEAVAVDPAGGPSADAPFADAPSAATPPAASKSPAGTNDASSTAPIATAPPSAKPAPSTRIADISFDDIKFDMEKGAAFERSMLTPKIEALDGRKIRIRGFILPPPVASGLTRFVLVRDNLSCCFGPGAALYDAIFVEMVDDKSTDYTISPVTVEGVFTIRELRDPDDNIMAIYHLDGESVW